MRAGWKSRSNRPHPEPKVKHYETANLYISPRLPLQTSAQLDNAGVIRLPADVEQTSGPIQELRRRVRMVERVEEIPAEAEPDTLRDGEVFEQRQVLVPRTWAEHEIPRIPTHVI